MLSPEETFAACVHDLALPVAAAADLEAVIGPISRWVVGRCVQTPFFVGVAGAQGSGKSTFCRLLACWLEAHHGLRVAVVSIDDLYRTRSERNRLAEEIHPLCAIRGVPGTHDVALGVALFAALDAALRDSHTCVPRFDKATDDRLPTHQWDTFAGRPDVVLFEGWCVGATVPPVGEEPTNDREARDDPDGTWREWSDAALRNDYGALFARLDAQIMLQVPSMQAVRRGRWRQEKRRWDAAERTGSVADSPGLLTIAEVNAYVDLFERHTLHMLATMPAHADVLVSQDDDFKQSLVRLPHPQ
jgi:D-glycerate 3-kinase